MQKVYDLTVAVGEYKQNGENKTKWLNIGAIYRDDDNKSFMLLNKHFNPAGIPTKDNYECIHVNLFKPQERSQQQSRSNNSDNAFSW